MRIWTRPLAALLLAGALSAGLTPADAPPARSCAGGAACVLGRDLLAGDLDLASGAGADPRGLDPGPPSSGPGEIAGGALELPPLDLLLRPAPPQAGDLVELYAKCGCSLGLAQVEYVLPNGDPVFYLPSHCDFAREP